MFRRLFCIVRAVSSDPETEVRSDPEMELCSGLGTEILVFLRRLCFGKAV